jgi:hypothetical protein
MCFVAVCVALSRAQNEMSASTLNLHAGLNQGAIVYFGEEYVMGTKPSGFFIEYEKEDVMTINRQGEVTVRSEMFSAQKIAADSLSLGGIPQWQLVALEMFNSISPEQAGWFTGAETNAPTTNCSDYVILTGPTGNQKVPNLDSFSKHWEELPSHTHLNIKVTAHFVDDWQGEVAFMKINDHVVWTDSHDQRASRGDFNVCGRKYPDSKFTVPIEITIPHQATNVKISFGSTLDTTAMAAFGISSLQLNIRSQPRPSDGASPVPPLPAPVAPAVVPK